MKSSSSVTNNSTISKSEVEKTNIDGIFGTAVIALFSYLILPKLRLEDFDLWQGIFLALACTFFLLFVLVFFSWHIVKDRKKSNIIRLLSYDSRKTPVILCENDAKKYQSEQKASIGKRMNIIIFTFLILSCGFGIAFRIYEPAESSISKNYMKATINNEELEFSLMSAVKGPTAQGETSIGAVFFCINPHHDIRYSLIVQMDGNTGPGREYTDKNNDAKVQILLTKGFIFDVGLTGDIYSASATRETVSGRFSFEITDRDESWTHYHGKMSASLQPWNRAGIPDANAETYEINISEFDFTITDVIGANMPTDKE